MKTIRESITAGREIFSFIWSSFGGGMGGGGAPDRWSDERSVNEFKAAEIWRDYDIRHAKAWARNASYIAFGLLVTNGVTAGSLAWQSANEPPPQVALLSYDSACSPITTFLSKDKKAVESVIAGETKLAIQHIFSKFFVPNDRPEFSNKNNAFSRLWLGKHLAGRATKQFNEWLATYGGLDEERRAEGVNISPTADPMTVSAVWTVKARNGNRDQADRVWRGTFTFEKHEIVSDASFEANNSGLYIVNMTLSPDAPGASK